jgi:hypothetical protein
MPISCPLVEGAYLSVIVWLYPGNYTNTGPKFFRAASGSSGGPDF